MSQAPFCHLQELVRQVRTCTLSLLERTPPGWLQWAAPGTSNHILWHAGHVLWVQDVLIIEPITGRSELPGDWEATFGQDCRPVKETTTWPEISFVVSALQKQQARLLEVIELADPAGLLDVAAPSPDWNLPRGILHGLHDEGRHQGEMYLLMKLRRAQEQPT